MAYQNFYATKLGTAIGASDVTISVQTPPTAPSGRLVIEPRNAQLREIISYTGVAGTTLTGVTRGLYGTSAQPHLSGSLVEMNFLAQDYQDLVDAFNSFSGSNGGGWNTMVNVPNSVTNNGNGSYTLGYASGDVSALLSPGTRLETTRTVAAPVQCADLESSSSQYFNRTASITGMTFTDDFTCMAWVKLESYQTGTNGAILYRFNGTNGWGFRINATGQVEIFGAATTFDIATSYQSIPLGKWVHVAATLDMSGTTSTIYINGVLVPSSYSNGGATAVTQAGDLQVGKSDAATYFDGKIAQAAVFSSILSAATIRSYMTRGLVGNEATLVSAYSLSNSLNDLSANNNHLTANGGAVATNADSPFGGRAVGGISSILDYAIVQQIVNPTTIVVQVPEGCTIPATGGISAVRYSNMKSPYGFPSDPARYRVEMVLFNINQTIAIGALNQWYPFNVAITVPIGKWRNLGYQGTIQISPSSAGAVHGHFTLSNTVPINGVRSQDWTTIVYNGATTGAALVPATKVLPFETNVSTTFTMYADAVVAGGTINAACRGDFGLFTISAENALV